MPLLSRQLNSFYMMNRESERTAEGPAGDDEDGHDVVVIT